MEKRDIKIDYKKLLIHPLVDKDLDRLKDMRKNTNIYRFEPDFLVELQGSPEEALRRIQGMDLSRDRQCILGIYEKEKPDFLVGLIELYDYKKSGIVISVGVRILPDSWGKGLAQGSTLAILNFLKKETDVKMVTAHVIPDNKASSNCLIKCGFEFLHRKTEDWGNNKNTVADVYTFDI